MDVLFLFYFFLQCEECRIDWMSHLTVIELNWIEPGETYGQCVWVSVFVFEEFERRFIAMELCVCVGVLPMIEKRYIREQK